MTDKKFIWAGVVAVVGALQAWDSGVLRSAAAVQALVALAIVAPASALALTREARTQAVAIAAAFVLLTIARVLAPAPLPTLHLIAFVPAVILIARQAVRPFAGA